MVKVLVQNVGRGHSYAGMRGPGIPATGNPCVLKAG